MMKLEAGGSSGGPRVAETGSAAVVATWLRLGPSCGSAVIDAPPAPHTHTQPFQYVISFSL